MDMGKELSKVVKILKDSDGKSNREIAESLGIDLDSYDFFELIEIKEYQLAQKKYSLEYSRWKAGFTGKFKPAKYYKLSPAWTKFFSQGMDHDYGYCLSSDWDSEELGDCLILDNKMEVHPNFPESVPKHIISVTPID